MLVFGLLDERENEKKGKRKEKRERKKRKGGGEKHNSNKSFMLPSIQLLMYETVEQSKLIKVF